MALSVGVLGPFRLSVDGAPVAVQARRQRQLVSALAFAVGQPLETDALIDRLWGEAAPPSAAHALAVYSSALRKLAGEPVVLQEHGRHRLACAVDAVDAWQFTALVDAGRYRDALALWRGSPVPELDSAVVAGELARLHRLRLHAGENHLAEELASGRSGAVVQAAGALLDEHPYHEGLHALYLTALYRSGRQADALRSYEALRVRLAEELGVTPGPALVELEARILRHDERLALPRSAPVDAAPPVELPPALELPPRPLSSDERRTVSVLFSDLVGSTPLGETLDADEFKLVVDGAVARIIAAVEAYGGVVVNVAGDGVCALFGAPHAHEDDAERAVRAGLDIAEALQAYGAEVAEGWGVERLAVRVGVHTGPVALVSWKVDQLSIWCGEEFWVGGPRSVRCALIEGVPDGPCWTSYCRDRVEQRRA